jgi:hypothetical protein
MHPRAYLLRRFERIYRSTWFEASGLCYSILCNTLQLGPFLAQALELGAHSPLLRVRRAVEVTRGDIERAPVEAGWKLDRGHHPPTSHPSSRHCEVTGTNEAEPWQRNFAPIGGREVARGPYNFE